MNCGTVLGCFPEIDWQETVGGTYMVCNIFCEWTTVQHWHPCWMMAIACLPWDIKEWRFVSKAKTHWFLVPWKEVFWLVNWFFGCFSHVANDVEPKCKHLSLKLGINVKKKRTENRLICLSVTSSMVANYSFWLLWCRLYQY